MKCRECGKDAVGMIKVSETVGEKWRDKITSGYYEGLCEKHLIEYINAKPRT